MQRSDRTELPSGDEEERGRARERAAEPTDHPDDPEGIDALADYADQTELVGIAEDLLKIFDQSFCDQSPLKQSHRVSQYILNELEAVDFETLATALSSKGHHLNLLVDRCDPEVRDHLNLYPSMQSTYDASTERLRGKFTPAEAKLLVALDAAGILSLGTIERIENPPMIKGAWRTTPAARQDIEPVACPEMKSPSPAAEKSDVASSSASDPDAPFDLLADVDGLLRLLEEASDTLQSGGDPSDYVDMIAGNLPRFEFGDLVEGLRAKGHDVDGAVVDFVQALARAEQAVKSGDRNLLVVATDLVERTAEDLFRALKEAKKSL